MPLGVDLSHKKGLSRVLLHFSTRTCSVIRIAKVSMDMNEIVENVNAAAIKGVVRFVPKNMLGVSI